MTFVSEAKRKAAAEVGISTSRFVRIASSVMRCLDVNFFDALRVTRERYREAETLLKLRGDPTGKRSLVAEIVALERDNPG